MIEALFRIIFARVIVGFFGYYTLLFFYRLTNNQQGIDWLSKPSDELEDLTGSCLINIVGFVVFAVIVYLIIFVYYELLDTG